MSSESITIVEVGPRDGLQSEPEILPTESKVKFIEMAIDAGIRRLEVASFVHPKRVPQMADAEALIEKLPQRDDVSYIGLIMNERGLDRALTTQVDEVGMVVLSTDTYNHKNQRVGIDESIVAWRKIAKRAQDNGLRANVMISSAFGCPYEGEVKAERIVDLAKRVIEAGPAELGIADSIGVAVPSQVTDLLGMLREVIGDLPVRCHLHNTRNTGLANAHAAVEAGVTYLDASIGGIGGCPFAPAATGNIPTDDLLYMLDRSGVGQFDQAPVRRGPGSGQFGVGRQTPTPGGLAPQLDDRPTGRVEGPIGVDGGLLGQAEHRDGFRREGHFASGGRGVKAAQFRVVEPGAQPGLAVAKRLFGLPQQRSCFTLAARGNDGRQGGRGAHQPIDAMRHGHSPGVGAASGLPHGHGNQHHQGKDQEGAEETFFVHGLLGGLGK